MERGSIVDAQVELEEQVSLEIERCLDPYYFYINYFVVKDLHGVIVQTSRRYNRKWHQTRIAREGILNLTDS